MASAKDVANEVTMSNDAWLNIEACRMKNAHFQGSGIDELYSVYVFYPKQEVRGHTLSLTQQASVAEFKDEHSGETLRARRTISQHTMDHRTLTQQTTQMDKVGMFKEPDSYMSTWEYLWPQQKLQISPQKIFAKNFVNSYKFPSQIQKGGNTAPTNDNSNDGWVEIPLTQNSSESGGSHHVNDAEDTQRIQKMAHETKAKSPVGLPRVNIDVRSEDEDYYSST